MKITVELSTKVEPDKVIVVFDRFQSCPDPLAEAIEQLWPSKTVFCADPDTANKIVDGLEERDDDDVDVRRGPRLRDAA
jgi:hypothetical protein